MTVETAPQTKLDAVNMILWSIGETPVNSLDVSGIRDVAIAELKLDETTRRVLNKGWDFNTDDEWELAADGSGHVLIPANALRVDPMDRSKRYVVRDDAGQRKFWDKDEHTYVIGETVEVKIVWAYEFDEIPESGRMYIATRAARAFQAGAMGSELLYKFTDRDEREALAEFRRDHALVRNANVLKRDPTFHRFHNP
jgi:hypothetical protein